MEASSSGFSCSMVVLLVLVLMASATVVAAAQQPPGFLSLTCGGTTSSTDSNGIFWAEDSSYVTTGNTTSIDFIDGSSTSRVHLRFFPDSESGRNCYRLLTANTSLVLVRPSFYYKNYDGKNMPPSFKVSIGTSLITTINLTSSDPWVEEFIWPVSKDSQPFCLHSIPGAGFPVISSLEVRPLPAGAYNVGPDDTRKNMLRKRFRINCGYLDGPLRYPFDSYDRVWDSDKSFSPSHLSSGFSIPLPLDISDIKESPPVRVLQTARVLARRSVLTYEFPLSNAGNYHVVLYFGGILPVSSTFNVLINGEIVLSYFNIQHAEASTIFFSAKKINSINITLQNVSFYPQVNAIEIFEVVEIPLECSSTTVLALQVIQQSTGFDFGWQDDPCSPTPWNHIGCEGSLVTSLVLSNIDLREISPTFSDLLDLKILDLHNASLAGEIANLGALQELKSLNLSFNKLTSFGSAINTLVRLQSLDVKNNSLEGTVPESLGRLKDLRLLNLENNKLQGTLPQSLKKENLEIRTSGNLCLSFSSSTCTTVPDQPLVEKPHVPVFNTKKRSTLNHKAILIGTVAGICCAFLFIPLTVFIYKRRNKGDDLTFAATRDMRNWNAAKVFSYKEIKVATNNFKDVIGSGSFGSVYLGKLPDEKLVAVKVRFDRTQLGADSFINEVYLLSQVHHQNLIALEGFCYESKQQILVYEYLPSGSLADNLYGSNSKKRSLNWARRLKIVVDAAKGLDYLHNGSDPRIIHRDVKSSNILLDSEMNAKVSDFGLCKQVLQADATHVTTSVKGTAGYLDPEYYATQQLTEKSDVYSFGVVLLELICGREPLSHSGSPDSHNLVLWAKPYFQAGAFEIVDDNLKGSFDRESMGKVASIAARSVERDASHRPTMAEVLAELKEAYAMQLSHLAAEGHIN